MFVAFVRRFKSKEDVPKHRLHRRLAVTVVLHRTDIIIRHMDVKSIEAGLAAENHTKLWTHER